MSGLIEHSTRVDLRLLLGSGASGGKIDVQIKNIQVDHSLKVETFFENKISQKPKNKLRSRKKHMQMAVRVEIVDFQNGIYCLAQVTSSFSRCLEQFRTIHVVDSEEKTAGRLAG